MIKNVLSAKRNWVQLDICAHFIIMTSTYKVTWWHLVVENAKHTSSTVQTCRSFHHDLCERDQCMSRRSWGTTVLWRSQPECSGNVRGALIDRTVGIWAACSRNNYEGSCSDICHDHHFNALYQNTVISSILPATQQSGTCLQDRDCV